VSSRELGGDDGYLIEVDQRTGSRCFPEPRVRTRVPTGATAWAPAQRYEDGTLRR
jgi:hypothetical protein